MIFVTVGTTEFNGLTEAADNLNIKEEIIIQKANGKYIPKNHKSFKFSDSFDDYLEKADIVITHGGAGTIFKLLDMNKKIIAVANNERDDLHQSDLTKKLSDENYLSWCKDLKNLRGDIKKIQSKEFNKYKKPENKIIEKMKELI